MLTLPLLVLLAAAETSLTPVPFKDVMLTEGFWADRQRVNAGATLDANWAQCEKTGRLANFAKAAAKLKGDSAPAKYEGYYFNDSDVYKMLEGACDVLATTTDIATKERLTARIEALIALIASAQHPSGYINGYFTLNEPDEQFANLRDKHELYCAGHLIEAGVAHFNATGKRSLLDVAVKLADFIDATFGPAPKRAGVCGHEEVELALIKLARATGEQRYMVLARYFVEQRGRAEALDITLQPTATGGKGREVWGEVFQDFAPIREHTRAVGHAVRATYYYSAVADLVRFTKDTSYLPALGRVWDDLTLTKMYVTGGIGTSAANEGFTTSFDLPNETAYAETCAGIGLVLWAHRMALLNGDEGAKYLDVAERTLYNAALSGVSLDGSRFFYDNPLASKGKHHRREWFECACCPPNILRLVAQLGGLFYSQQDDSIFLNLYGSNLASFTLVDETGIKVPVKLLQQTDYPWSGKVKVCIDVAKPAEFSLWFRVPGWSPRNRIAINGDIQLFDPFPRPGTFFEVRREWKPADCIEFTFDMPVQRVYANPAVKADRGRVALQRGPLMYCFEGVDQTVGLGACAIPAQVKIAPRKADDLLGGVTVLDVMALAPAEDTLWNDALYQSPKPREVNLTAIPYFAWDNRAACEMKVWMPESVAMIDQPPDPTIKASSSHCFAKDSVEAMYDGIEPANSADESVPRMTWWDRRGTTEWAQYDFISPRVVSGVSVYWYDDSGKGGQCKAPKAWRVMCMDGGTWKEVEASGAGALNKFDEVLFAPVVTSAVRLEVDLQDDGKTKSSGGIIEWRVIR